MGLNLLAKYSEQFLSYSMSVLIFSVVEKLVLIKVSFCQELIGHVVRKSVS